MDFRNISFLNYKLVKPSRVNVHFFYKQHLWKTWCCYPHFKNIYGTIKVHRFRFNGMQWQKLISNNVNIISYLLMSHNRKGDLSLYRSIFFFINLMFCCKTQIPFIFFINLTLSITIISSNNFDIDIFIHYMLIYWEHYNFFFKANCLSVCVLMAPLSFEDWETAT